jgi:EAL domain-containing protein (putative c-di-GMP-specific phosphodiesterase class I)
LYLRQFPARELKIDRGFIRQLGDSPADVAIVASLVALGKTLGLRVVAEGVETLAQQATLTAAGCDELQGYRLGRPVPGGDLVVIPASAVMQGSGTQRILPELLVRASDQNVFNGNG